MNTEELTMLATRLEQALAEVPVTEVARATGFLRRRRQITPHRLVLALFAALGSQQVQSLADLCAAFNDLHRTQVTYHPFRNQLAKPSCARFLQGLLQHWFTHLVVHVLQPAPRSALAAFREVWLHDSSGLAVHACLRDTFPGRYPVKAPAVVELHVTQALFTDQPQAVTLTGQRANPHAHLPEPATLQGGLLLADRAYVNTTYAREVAAAGGFLVIRYTHRVNPQIRRCWVAGKRTRRFEGCRLQDVLAACPEQSLDLDVVWEATPHRPAPVTLRLVALWNPAVRGARGRTRAEHVLLATNLPRTTYPPSTIGALYHLRWQIELLFKEWKSYANLHAFPTRDPHVTEALIWAALGAAFLKRFLAHAAQRVAGTGAISTRKVAMYVGPRLRQVLAVLATGSPVVTIFRETVTFLSRQGRRSNPRREQAHGRAAHGLRPVCLVPDPWPEALAA